MRQREDQEANKHEIAPYDENAYKMDHPRGTVAFNYLLMGGEPDKLENFRYILGRQEGEFHLPRHRHTFEQIRLPLVGDMNLGEQGILREGEIGYFPEGQTYGPQDDPLGSPSASEQGSDEDVAVVVGQTSEQATARPVRIEYSPTTPVLELADPAAQVLTNPFGTDAERGTVDAAPVSAAVPYDETSTPWQTCCDRCGRALRSNDGSVESWRSRAAFGP